MSWWLHIAGQGLIAAAGLGSLALIVRQFQLYADKALSALLMAPIGQERRDVA